MSSRPGRSPGIRELLGFVRRRFVGAWLWALWAIAGLTIVLVNFRYLTTRTGRWPGFPPPFVVLGVLFAVSVLYVWPFVFRQSAGGLLRAIRNSVLAVLAAPLFALTLAAALVLDRGASARS